MLGVVHDICLVLFTSSSLPLSPPHPRSLFIIRFSLRFWCFPLAANCLFSVCNFYFSHSLCRNQMLRAIRVAFVSISSIYKIYFGHLYWWWWWFDSGTWRGYGTFALFSFRLSWEMDCTIFALFPSRSLSISSYIRPLVCSSRSLLRSRTLLHFHVTVIVCLRMRKQ